MNVSKIPYPARIGVAVPTHLLVHSHVTVQVQATQKQHVQVWVTNFFQHLHFSINHMLNYALVYIDMTLKVVSEIGKYC